MQLSVAMPAPRRVHIQNIATEHAARGKNQPMIWGEQRLGQQCFDGCFEKSRAGIQSSDQTSRYDTSGGRLRSDHVETLSENHRSKIQWCEELRFQTGADR